MAFDATAGSSNSGGGGGGGAAVVPSREFYSTFHGHEVGFLEQLHDACAWVEEQGDGGSGSGDEQGEAADGDQTRGPAQLPHLQPSRARRRRRRTIFLAGDSSLDNKYWLYDTAEPINGYERVLKPPTMKQDVCYWINRECVERGIGSQFWCINAAIEATSLNTRALCRLPAQDRLIRDRIGADDVLVVSVGGNDIALQPLLATVASTCCLVCCTTRSCLQHGTACPPNIPACDCGCLCCGLPACLQNCLGWPCGLGYMVDLFKNRVENYVRRLVEVTRPSKVVVCMIYFPDEAARDSWAGAALSCLRYNTNPDKLQLAIRKVFELATSNISIPGTEVVAFPLYRALDGTDTRDYVHRVEPSALGGSKMAAKLLDAIL
eukprot:m.261688 g.261688  ORF g.261688 m.261688 type:complete len:378 (-) comp19225_c1_seq24:240-1373(-)